MITKIDATRDIKGLCSNNSQYPPIMYSTISTHVAAIDIASVAATADPAVASNFAAAAD